MEILKPTETNEKEYSAHLFVLIHGLWGGPNHMSTIEGSLKDLLPSCSNEKIVTLKPSNFRFWKTYDGLKLNSQRIIKEIFYEVETLKQKNNFRVTKISIVGYSLGGLLARYVIGVLDEMGFFEQVEPVFFTTFATPHVGIEFFNNNIFDRTANHVGQYLFGKSGREIFLRDTQNTMIEMADPQKKFYKGLIRFQKHILLANVNNDRTVPFFTSYITEYSPFEDWEVVKIKYLKNLPQARIGKIYVKPKFVDLTRSQAIREPDEFKGNIQEETSFFRSNRIARILVICILALFLLPIWFPLVLMSSFVASMYSMIKVRIASLPHLDQHWLRVKNSVYGDSPVDPEDAKIGQDQRDERRKLANQESFNGDTSEITENAMENIMYAEERFTGKSPHIRISDEDGDADVVVPDKDLEANDESDSGSDHNEDNISILSNKTRKMVVDIDIRMNDDSIESHLSTLLINDCSKFPLFTDKAKLPVNDDKQFIINSLNTISWIKIPVYIDAWNAHDGIIARRGPRTNPKGTATICLWCSILRRHLKVSE